MIARIVRNRGSRYLLLPESVFEAAGITDYVDLTVEAERLVIRPAAQPRAGWAEAIQKHGNSTAKRLP